MIFVAFALFAVGVVIVVVISVIEEVGRRLLTVVAAAVAVAVVDVIVVLWFTSRNNLTTSNSLFPPKTYSLPSSFADADYQWTPLCVCALCEKKKKNC